MNEHPPSGWRRPLPGKIVWLASFALLTLLIYCLGVAGGNGRSSPVEVFFVAALLSALALLIGYGLMRFLRWLFCWRNLRRFAFGVACLVTLIALVYFVENVRGRSAWMRHRQQWEAQGEKFSIAELSPPPVPEEKNFAFTPLLKPALDYFHTPTNIVWRDTNALARLSQLGADLAPRREKDDKLVLGQMEKGTLADLATWQAFYRGNTNYPQPNQPGTPAQDILVALGKFDSELTELHEAVRTRPETRFPVEYDYEPSWAILLPHLARLKGITTLTHVRATALLEAGRSAEALEDLELGLRLSESISREPVLIDHLVRIASLGINLQTIREGLVRHAWSDAQLAKIEQLLARVDMLAEYKLAQRGERALSVAGLDYLRRQGFRSNPMMYLSNDEGGSASTMGFNPFPSGWFYQNMLTISELHQEFTLACVDTKSGRVLPEVCEALQTRIEKLPRAPYTIFAKLLMPALSKAVRRSARMQTAVGSARIACALERYRLAQSELPDSLEKLVPSLLPQLPNDLIDDKPLRYRREPDGGYRLWSVGWNRTDERGEIAWTKSKEPGVDMAQGDWVWQIPKK